jgi:hypothetical protein
MTVAVKVTLLELFDRMVGDDVPSSNWVGTRVLLVGGVVGVVGVVVGLLELPDPPPQPVIMSATDITATAKN